MCDQKLLSCGLLCCTIHNRSPPDHRPLTIISHGLRKRWDENPFQVRDPIHRLKLLHRRQASPTGEPECSRLKRALLEWAAELCRSIRARTLGFLLLLGTATQGVSNWPACGCVCRHDVCRSITPVSWHVEQMPQATLSSLPRAIPKTQVPLRGRATRRTWTFPASSSGGLMPIECG